MPPRLKSLVLQGYKTFATRTEFQFPGVITAIVGPNGSGKSNIADAMRWVLGEQSFSLLRGRKTEDMIFSGSEQRPRAGMASATITFDNTDNWLPIDYSEVAITRRAYRDGQNEYLLNGQRVRLREISELLARSGLAERTYTIIGQGLVDAALALKPEERRKLFEEAAGIGLYRSRREESINRLENTRRNLERVQDILVELEPRLRSLEKQARRVDEYDRLQGELRLLLRDWYGYQWHRAQREVTHAVDQVRVEEAKSKQAREHLMEVSAELAVYRGQLQEVRGKLNEWHRQSAGLHEAREKINRNLAVLEERQKALTDQKNTFASDLARLDDDLLQRKERLAGIQSESRRLETDLEEAQRQLEQAKKELSEQQNQRAEIEKTVRRLRQLQLAAETRRVQLRARGDELSGRINQFDLAHLKATKSLDSFRAEAEKCQKNLDEARLKKSEAEAARDRSAARLEKARKALDEQEVERRKELDARAQLDARFSRLEAQLDVLEQAEKSLSGVAEGAKAIIQAARQGKIPGKAQAINSLMEVPAVYETAIAAALGDLLDVVILGEDADPDIALQVLENSQKGRAALLPFRWLAETASVPFPSDPDCLGLASDLITAPAELIPAIRALLGQVLVVRDRQAASRLRRQNGFAFRIVTLKGEVFHPNGLTYAGRDTRGGALSRPRQKRELADAAAAVQAELRQASEKLAQLEQKAASARQDQKQIEAEVLNLRKTAEQAGEAWQQSRMATEQARRQAEWQTNQIVTLESQLSESRVELEKNGHKLAAVEEDVASTRDQVRDANARLGSLPLDEFQNQVAHWNTSCAVTSRAIQEAGKRLEEHQQNISRNLTQQADLTARMTGCDNSLVQLEEEKSRLHAQEASSSAQIAELQEQILPQEAEIDKLEKAFADQQEEEQSAQQASALAERILSQGQMDLARQKESIDNLKRRIEDDFGLVAFEYTHEVPAQEPLPFEGMVEELPVLSELPESLEQEISRLRGQIRRLGAINPEAQAEYREVSERHQFMTNQVTDLRKADQDLRLVISELDELMRREFRKTFEAVAAEFKHLFTRLFGGGSARLLLVENDNPTESGIEIETRLPGRREQGLSLLSGGERSLTAVALVFSLLKISPTPFCVLDEVDAMLDEANVGRFRDLLLELSQQTQFLVITHNRNTVQAADVIYGITMGHDTASQQISLRLDQLSEEMVG